MKQKRSFLNVSILALIVWVVGFGLTPYAMAQQANEIYDIAMFPSSPAELLDGERVNIRFTYTTEEPDGVRIFVFPYTKGRLTPNAGVSPSPLYPVGKGEGTGFFTITSSDIVVDQVKFQMTNSDQSKVLLEFFIDVRFLFYAHSITNIVLSPPSPATLLPEGDIDITFDYATTHPGDVLIFARPFTNGSLTPGYWAHGSPHYPSGNGSGTGWFTIPYGNVAVDQIRFQIKDINQTQVLYELFIPVKYRFCEETCVWHVDADAPGANTGTNWVNAFNHLQDALAIAAPGDKIKVAEGAYKPDQGGGQTPGDRAATFSLINEVVIEGCYAGFGEPDPDARDTEAYGTILSGDIGTLGNNSDNSLHVVTSNFDDHNTVLDGFAITGGNAEGAYPDYLGGGMYIDYSSPMVKNCLFINNSAGAGGGLAVWHECTPTLINCIFIANSTTGAGGALCFQHSGPTLISCMILGNTAGSNGGGMWTLNNYDTPKLTNCVFSGNATMSSGGAISNAGVSSSPNPNPPVLTNCTFNDNSAALSGGGLYNTGGNDATVNSCIFWANTDAGGADESAQIHTSSLTPAVDYTCVQGLTGALGGTGNIGDDPWFVDADGSDDIVGTEDDDVHLLEGSPCIDTGHPALEYQDIDGSRNDMGAYGGPFGEVYEPPPHTGTGFIITNIGDLPTTEIGRDANEPNVGLANVDPDAAALFGVPQYKDSPFGSTLRVRGQFGLYDDVHFYQIMLAKWDDGNEPAPEDYVVLGEELGGQPLGKVRWYVDANGFWKHEYVRMGPDPIDGKDYLYKLNSPLDGSIWSNPDLRIRWNTRVCENGKYTITYKAYRWADPFTLVEVSLPPTDGWDHIVLLIDNNPVEAIIHDVRYDPNEGNPNYDPCTDGLIEECAIIGLTHSNENLRFTITATHPTGYLRRFLLDTVAGKNEYRGKIADESYSPTTPPYWDGVHSKEFHSKDAPPSLMEWKRCAYQFRLRTWGRANNGDHYIYYDIFSDHYYLDFGATTCMRADIDGSGTVDFKDLAELADNWLQTCEP
jgi:hypothetical protein